MPNIDEIKEESTKKFKKRKYRSWNMDGTFNEEAKTVLSGENINQTHNTNVLEVNPRLIKNWDFHDRPESELGDITSLAEDFKKIGQQQPCIVRKAGDNSKEYELIIGERRWRAAKEAGLLLKVIVTDYDDKQAALAQATENDQRKDLSDYAKGISFSKQIENGIIKQKDLIETLGKSKQYVSALLSFSKIPKVISQEIRSYSLLPSRTAERIYQASQKGPEYIDALIHVAKKHLSKPLSWERIERLLNEELSPIKKSPTKEVKKILSSDGRHIFTWRNDNNELPSIHFPKNIISLLERGNIDKENLTMKILLLLENELENIKDKKSANADFPNTKK